MSMLLKRKTEQPHELAVKNSNNSAPEYQCSQTTCSSACKRAKKSFPQDALHGPTMLCATVREMRRNFAKTSSRVRAIFSDASPPRSVRFPGDAMRLSMRLFCASEKQELEQINGMSEPRRSMREHHLVCHRHGDVDLAFDLRLGVRFWPKADILSCIAHVHFWG